MYAKVHTKFRFGISPNILTGTRARHELFPKRGKLLINW